MKTKLSIYETHLSVLSKFIVVDLVGIAEYTIGVWRIEFRESREAIFINREFGFHK